MSDNLPHSEETSVKDTSRPKANGQGEGVPESDPVFKAFLEKLGHLEDESRKLGRIAGHDIMVGDGILIGTPIIPDSEFQLPEEHRLELGEITPEKAQMIASEVVGMAWFINASLHARKAKEPRGMGDIEPASPLMLAGKLLAAIDHMQTSGERGRDQYRHADEVVSMLGLAWRMRFAEDVGTEALDELRFLGYVHNISKGIGNNLIIKEVLEALELPQADRGAPHSVLIAQAHKYFTRVPEPEELSSTYNLDIEHGIELGGLWFTLPKFACVQDMLWLEEDSPLKRRGKKQEERIDQRNHAKKQLSNAAADLGFDDPLLFGTIPHMMETLKPEDIEAARHLKSNFGLWEAAKSVQQNIRARLG